MSRDQVLKYLELQEQGYRVTKEVAEQLGYKGEAPQRILRQDLRRNGYESRGGGYYVLKDSCEDKSIPKCADTSKSNTVKTNEGHKRADTSKGNTVKTNDVPKCADNSTTLDDATIKKLLTLADKFDNIISNTPSNTFGDAFRITPCKSPTAQTIKVDYDVWQKFKKFAKASDYKQQDLLTTALELLMEQLEG